MKTTIDLPEGLVRELKLRAVHERRPLKDVAADAIRQGLATSTTANEAPQFRITKDPKTGLPVIESCNKTAPVRHLAPDEISDILIQQEARWALGESDE